MLKGLIILLIGNTHLKLLQLVKHYSDGKDYNLNIASTDSGSSLLNIEINELHNYRIRKEDFLPVEKKIVKTIKTEKIFQKFSDDQPTLLKLDTQGTELNILDGIEDIKKEKLYQ